MKLIMQSLEQKPIVNALDDLPEAGRSSDTDSFSIIVIAYNEEHYLPALLESLKRQTWQKFEVIVVDSNSSDRTVAIANSYRDQFASFNLVELSSTQGPAYARNQGVHHASCERLLFLDADVTLQPDFLETAMQLIDDSHACVATCHLRINGSSRLSSFGAFFLNASMKALKPIYKTAYGACLFSTKTAHTSIGGFMEELGICEDCNYIRRAVREEGYRLSVFPLSFETSDRRTRNEGSLKLFLKYIHVHSYRLITRREIYSGEIAYDYGNYANLEQNPERHVSTASWSDGATRLSQVYRLIMSPHFYMGLFVLVLGIQLTFMSQRYLHDYVAGGNTLPVLSDLVLDNLPYWDIGFMYDVASFVALLIFSCYVIHRKRFRRVPYILVLCGIFHLVRGIFIVLTPFGNPPLFDGTEGWFNGFSNFEFGVYPSGHTGINFLYFLLATDRRYRSALLVATGVVIVSLFLARGHYSIDVLSGLFFAYAIKAYGDRHILKHVTPKGSEDIV